MADEATLTRDEQAQLDNLINFRNDTDAFNASNPNFQRQVNERIAELEAKGRKPVPFAVGEIERVTEERLGPQLQALKELRLGGEPAAKRKAFTPFARRGFGASGLARRGVREALSKREAQFARERERIRAEVQARAVQESLVEQEIEAARGA